MWARINRKLAKSPKYFNKHKERSNVRHSTKTRQCRRKGAASKLKTLPQREVKRKVFKAISDQVNALKEPTTAATANETQRGEGTEPMPMPRYGSRPGEKRIDTSSYGDSAIKAPVYDRGGDVSMAAAKQAQSAGDAGIQNFVNAP